MPQDLLYFTVAISAVGLGGAAPDDGFIDNNSAQSYIQPGTGGTVDEGTGWATNLADAQAKSRANLRWNAVLQQLSATVNPYSFTDIVATGATASAAATAINFTVAYDRPDYLYAYDELNVGAMLYNANAIQRWIARALIQTINIDNWNVLDPTAYTTPNYYYGNSNQAITAGPLAANLAAASSAVTVTFMSAYSGTTVYPL